MSDRFHMSQKRLICTHKRTMWHTKETYTEKVYTHTKDQHTQKRHLQTHSFSSAAEADDENTKETWLRTKETYTNTKETCIHIKATYTHLLQCDLGRWARPLSVRTLLGNLAPDWRTFARHPARFDTSGPLSWRLRGWNLCVCVSKTKTETMKETETEIEIDTDTDTDIYKWVCIRARVRAHARAHTRAHTRTHTYV